MPTALEPVRSTTLVVQRFVWRDGARQPVAPDVAAQELDTIIARQGVVTPEAVVAAASPLDAPLHPAFDWDDTSAARKFREQQARTLMGSLLIEYRTPDGTVLAPTRYVIKLQPAADDDDATMDETTANAIQPRVYILSMTANADDALRHRRVQQAYRELLSWQARYREIAAFAKLFAVIDDFTAELDVA